MGELQSVLSNVKQDAITANSAQEPPEPTAIPSIVAPPENKELQGVLSDVKQSAAPSSVSSTPIPSQEPSSTTQTPSDDVSITHVVTRALIPDFLKSDADQLKDATDFMQHTSAGRITDAFVQSSAQAANNSLYGEHLPIEEIEKTAPINGMDKWQNAMNEYVVRPAVYTAAWSSQLMGNIMNAMSIPFSGAVGALEQAGKEGVPLASTAAETLSDPAMMQVLHMAAVSIPKMDSNTIHDFVTKPPLPHDVYRGVDNGILPANPEIKAEAAQYVNATTLPKDIHEAARFIAPDTFDQYDRLSAQRQTLSDQLQKVRDDAVENAPHNEEISDLKKQLEDENNRANIRRINAKIRDFTAKNDDFVQQSVNAPEVQEIRNQHQAADIAMRDLAPQVSAAYRNAQARMPAVEVAPIEVAPEVKSKEQSTQPAQTPDLFNRESAEKNKANIADDVSKQLVAAGRSHEEAQAGAAITSSFFDTMAKIYPERGNAQEWYDREGAKIVAGRGVRAQELAQDEQGQEVIPGAEKISDKEFAERKMEGRLKPKTGQKAADEGLFGDAHKQGELFSKTQGSFMPTAEGSQALIKLMKTQDASTFIHESGHHFLDIMQRYAREDDAPERLKDDVAAIEKYLGVPKGADFRETDAKGRLIYRQAHEKFARGFEQYLREGIAPTPELAGVFAKFKTWLTDLYKTIKGLGAPINDDIKSVFDKMLSEKPQRTIIAPERQAGKSAADIHEADAQTTPPIHADTVADNIRNESNAVAKTHAPEVHDELTGKTNGYAGESSESGSNANATRVSAREENPSASLGEISPGGTQTATQGYRAPTKSGVYEPVPREPLGLLSWVRKNGGLKDSGGDIASALGKGIKGIIKPKAGKTLDDMALKAWEEGYFPEKGEYNPNDLSNRPTVNEFLDKLVLDNTEKQYSAKDTQSAQSYHEALSHNEEVDRISNKFDVKVEGKTKEQFWNEVHDKMSIEEQAKDAQSLHDAQKAIAEEQEKKDKEFLESRGEAWEPVKTKRATLEDLENEYQSEISANKPQAGIGIPQQPEPTAGQSGQLEEGTGQNGGGVGARPEQAAEETGTTAGTIGGGNVESEKSLGGTTKSVDQLFDKAGNIKLDNLTNKEETRAALKEIASKTNLLNHDVTSDVEVAEMARSMGVKGNELNIEKLRALAIEDGIPLAARIRAGRQMLVDASDEAMRLAEKVDGGTDADLQNFLKAKDRFMMIAETVSGITYQWGLAGRAFRDISGAAIESAQNLEALFQQEHGTTKEGMKDLAKLVASKKAEGLDGQAAKVMQAAAKPGFWDQFAEYRRCSILSGWITHSLWLAGTGVNLLYKPFVLDTLGGIHNEIGMALGREDTGSRVLGGLEGLAHTITKALPNILSATGTAARTGKTVLRPYEGEYDTFLSTGGIRKTLNINMDELQKAVDAHFNPADYPELKAMQDRINSQIPGMENKDLQADLDKAVASKKKQVMQMIAARMQSRLKSWGELAGEMRTFASSTMGAIETIGKNMFSSDYYKDKPLLEARRNDGALPDIYSKGVPVLPIGTVMRGISSRIYSAMHTLCREVAANIETTQEARRVAIEGLTEEEKASPDVNKIIEQRRNQLLTDPSKDLMQRVNKIVNKQTLMSNESEFAKVVTKFRDELDRRTGTKIGSVLMPVIGVPAEATQQTVIESSPLGLLGKGQRGILTGEQGALAQERAQVKMMAGTALIGMGWYLASKGLATPSPSVNYQQEQERRDAGQQSGSARIGDWMVSLTHLPVTGAVLTAGADLHHIMSVAQGQDLSDTMKASVGSAVDNFFLHENSLVEMSNLIDAMRMKTDPAAYLKNEADSMIPQFIKQTNDVIDPVQRDSKSLKNSLLARIPSESDDLAPKIDALTGEVMQKEPWHVHTAQPDPIAEELMKVHIYPTNPHPNISGVDLNPKESSEYSSAKGHILHNGLQMLMQGDGAQDYNEADVNNKRKMIMKIERHSSDCAKAIMFNRYPDLLKDANDRYENECRDEVQ